MAERLLQIILPAQHSIEMPMVLNARIKTDWLLVLQNLSANINLCGIP